MLLYFHNPSANPYLADLLAFRYADEVLFNDCFGYNRKSASHRLKIGSEWLAFPTQQEKVKGEPLNVRCTYDQKFAYSLSQRLVFHYGKETHFDHFIAEVESLIIDTLHEEKTLVEAVWTITKNLMELAEWPYCIDIQRAYSLNQEAKLENIDVANLPKYASNNSLQVLHDYKSRNVQRQSDKAVELSDSLDLFLKKNLRLSLSDNLLDLLFKHGAYHNLNEWPDQSAVL